MRKTFTAAAIVIAAAPVPASITPFQRQSGALPKLTTSVVYNDNTIRLQDGTDQTANASGSSQRRSIAPRPRPTARRSEGAPS